MGNLIAGDSLPTVPGSRASGGWHRALGPRMRENGVQTETGSRQAQDPEESGFNKTVVVPCGHGSRPRSAAGNSLDPIPQQIHTHKPRDQATWDATIKQIPDVLQPRSPPSTKQSSLQLSRSAPMALGNSSANRNWHARALRPWLDSVGHRGRGIEGGEVIRLRETEGKAPAR
jgi:hypothetical protein